MPHCTLEYSSNVVDRPDMKRLLLDIHEALVKAGSVALAAIKSRAIKHEQFVVGDGDPNRAFVALTIQVFGGRSDEVKAEITDAAFQVLKKAFSRSVEQGTCGITVQIVDIHRPSYRRTD